MYAPSSNLARVIVPFPNGSLEASDSKCDSSVMDAIGFSEQEKEKTEEEKRIKEFIQISETIK